MNRLRAYLRRIAEFFNRSHHERDIADELRFHIDMEAEALRDAGVPDADSEARRRFGSASRYAEELRDERGGARLDSIMQDLRYAFRMLRRAPGFSATVILTLALAIGANTAVFSVVNAVLIAPLPFARPGDVVRLYSVNPDKTQQRFSISWADYVDWRREARSFTDIALFGNTVLTLSDDAEPERLYGLVATTNFFDILGVRPGLGKLFHAGDEATGNPSVVLSDAFWRRRFGADSNIIGRTIQLGGRSRTVTGVLPADFALDGRSTDAVLVLAEGNVADPQNHGQHLFESLARLRPGVSLQQAQADLGRVANEISSAHADVAGWSANVFRFSDETVRNTRTPLLILLGAAALVLLIGCINVTNLLTVRGTARAREVALRQSLGASRGRIVSQLMTETVVLALCGGVLGLVLATVGTKVIFALIPPGLLPRFTDPGADPAVLLFAFVVSSLTATFVGLWPALRASAAVTSERSRGNTAGARTVRVRQLLVVTEISLALVLLVCAGLVLQSLYNMVSVDPGFRAEGVSTMRIALSGPRYPNDTAQILFYRELLRRLDEDLAIESAGAANVPPIAGGGIITPIRLPGENRSAADRRMSPLRVVTPGYFATMGMRMIRGHDISWTDAQTTLVASESAANALWPGEDPIGKHVLFGAADDGPEVVGVVADSRGGGLSAAPPPVLYMAYSGAANVARTMSLVVRGPATHEAKVAAVRRTLHDLDPSLPVFNVTTVQNVVDQSVAQPRLNTVLLSVFAGLALSLAAIGIYGVISYSVTQRTQEFGVRMALGAQRTDVMRLVFREGVLLTVAGLMVGTAGAVAATGVIRTWLFGIGRGDVSTFAATAGALALIALVATLVPARRATRVDPIVSMRSD